MNGTGGDGRWAMAELPTNPSIPIQPPVWNNGTVALVGGDTETDLHPDVAYGCF